MTKESNVITEDISCIAHLPATLISTVGFHCEVWRCDGFVVRKGKKSRLDVVIKRHIEPCSFAEIKLLQRDYRELRRRLGAMAPEALFVNTLVDGVGNVAVIAEAITPWFNIANPAMADDAVPLLRVVQNARRQLQRFVEVAKEWHDQAKVIDLYGLDNLVLDINRQIRYLDSFRVFFYADLLYVVGEPDESLREKIEISVQRREYLEYLVEESCIVRIPGIGF